MTPPKDKTPDSTATVLVDEYEYEKLSKTDDQIRLLVILPGEKDDGIRCTLRNANLDSIKEADALSYTWGHPPSSKTIFVNDAPFKVRQNLFDALTHVRQPLSEVLLWIDAICINQLDIDERNHQVQQMADIFSRARRVLVWLGVETQKTQDIISFLSDAYLGSPFNRKGLMDDPRWVALNELCEEGYWKRVWIVQEICLASRVVVLCGRRQFPWQYISELRKARQHIWPQYLSSGERDFLRSLPCRIDQQKEARPKKGCVLWTLLETFKDSKCQEVHDKAYGFLGLSTDCGSQGLTVDYSKSITQIYREIIWFYHEKFRRDSSVHHAAQIMKLSEFLQALFGDLPQDDKVVQNLIIGPQSSNPSQRQLVDSRPMSSTLVSISACNLMVIKSFPTSDEAKAYRASDLVEFLEGEIPYSHLGDWRDLIESDLKGVSAINAPEAYAVVESKDELRPRSFQKVECPSVFIATPINGISADNQLDIVGVAPYGSQIGDIVITFVESHVALIMTDSMLESDAISEGGRKYRELRYNLVGRGSVFLSQTKSAFRVRSQLTVDKTIETVQLTSFEPELGELFPAVLSLDLSTLQLITKSSSNSLASGFNKPTLELMPANTSQNKVEDIYAHRLQKNINDSELQKMEQSPDLKRYALGPGYTAIINPGAIGFVICALQILYMLRPFRMAVLSSQDDPEQPMLSALRQLFWDLHKSLLPVNPLGLTKAFGWSKRELNEPQDFLEFWRTFTGRLVDTTLGPSCISFIMGKIKTSNRSTGSVRLEDFYDFDFHVNAKLNRLEDGLSDSCYDTKEGIRVMFTQLPQVLLLHASFFQYNPEIRSMGTYAGNFEYPSELDVAKYSDPRITDTLYQLHGVAVLEDVKPTPRYLLYLRPRQEDQWILFFKEMVSYAQKREVFEDNFRRDNDSTPRNAPLRTPYIFVYIQVSKLDHILG